jgi:regulator of protease activity HflC (stomatin/prohibitin superfamily)
MSLVAVEIPVQYVVQDVEAYERLGPPGVRDEILREAASRVVSRYFLTKSMDDVLGPGRHTMGADLLTLINEAYRQLNFRADGSPVVDVLFVGVNGAHPDRSVADQFEKVIQAQQTYRERIALAEAQRISTLARVVGTVDAAERIALRIDEVKELERSGADPERIARARIEVRQALEAAGGEAARTIARASAARWEKHMGARSQASLQAGQTAAYAASPKYYRAERYLQAMADALKNNRIFLILGAGDNEYDLDFHEQDTGQTFFADDISSETGG